MATLNIGSSTEYDSDGLKTALVVNFQSSLINSEVRKYIPKYSKINSVLYTYDAYQTIALGSTKADGKIFFGKDSSTESYLVAGGTDNVPKGAYTTIKKSTTTYVNTSGANAGELKSTYSSLNLYFTIKAMVTRTMKMKNLYVKYDYTKPTYTIYAPPNDSEYGTTYGNGTYDVEVSDYTVILRAEAKDGYKFVKWSDGNTNASRTITISQNSISSQTTTLNLTAIFEPQIYTITTVADPPEGGTVTGGGSYAYNTLITITAIPAEGYEFDCWYLLSSSNPVSEYVAYDKTFRAKFKKKTYTVNFKNQDGTSVKSVQLEYGKPLGTLPTVSRSGYTFAGWIPCAPAKKIDNSVLDSYYYDGNVAYPLLQTYKYTDSISMHIDVYMENWMDIRSSTRQIMSCTEGGGWGFGFQANSKVDGAEAHGFEVHTGSYTGYDLKFGTDGVYTNNNWYSFDIVFSQGVIEIFVDGVSKGKRTASGSAIKYNSSNTIFVGGEAKGDTSSAQNYFKGLISNVFIANQGSKLEIANSSTTVSKSVDYYPVWRKKAPCTITTSVSPAGAGTITGGGTYEYGTSKTLTATPSDGYEFVEWSDGVKTASRSITVSENATYTAIFRETSKIYCGTKKVTAVYSGTQKLSGDCGTQKIL